MKRNNKTRDGRAPVTIAKARTAAAHDAPRLASRDPAAQTQETAAIFAPNSRKRDRHTTADCVPI
jgi:hypothetical protein